MKTETITWHQLPHDGMPDAEITVLLELLLVGDGAVDCWPGWWSGDAWVEAASGDKLERTGSHKVLAWAHMPAGSTAADVELVPTGLFSQDKLCTTPEAALSNCLRHDA